MNFDEGEIVTALRQSLERFVEREMPRPAAARWDKDNHFPRDVHRKLADLGVLGLTIPEEYGGVGRDRRNHGDDRGIVPTQSCRVGPLYHGRLLCRHEHRECGTEAQKRELLPKIAAECFRL